jgi:CHAT domain-containing protein
MEAATVLPRSADLVVLSACQTGRIPSYNTEGVMRLARACFDAGSLCSVCSRSLHRAMHADAVV